MPATVPIKFPDLTQIPSYKAFCLQYPDIHCSHPTFYRQRNKQKIAKEIKVKVQRSIVQEAVDDIRSNEVDTHDEDIKAMVALAKTQNIPLKSLMPPTQIMEITRSSIQSIKRHMVTQWQAAAWWLERVHPEIFAKRDAAPNAAAVIGIRLEVCQRDTKAIPQATEANMIETKAIQQISAENA